MGFEWDRAKAGANQLRHRVAFSDAIGVLSDGLAITVPEQHLGEERFVTIGTDTLNRVLVVVYCWRGEHIRIISARRATRRERRGYQEEK